MQYTSKRDILPSELYHIKNPPSMIDNLIASYGTCMTTVQGTVGSSAISSETIIKTDVKPNIGVEDNKSCEKNCGNSK